MSAFEKTAIAGAFESFHHDSLFAREAERDFALLALEESGGIHVSPDQGATSGGQLGNFAPDRGQLAGSMLRRRLFDRRDVGSRRRRSRPSRARFSSRLRSAAILA